MSFSLITGEHTIEFPDTPQARQLAQMLAAQAVRRATTQPFSSPAGHATRASAKTHNFTSTTPTTNSLNDGPTAEPTVRSEISVPQTFSTTDCVLRSVKPNIIYDTTSNLSTTTNYFKLDMHEHQQQSTTSHSQNYQPSFVPLICKSESFDTTVEPLRGLCTTSDLSSDDCGRLYTCRGRSSEVFTQIDTRNHLDVCKILSFPFTGSAADHVKELQTTSDLHCNVCDRPQIRCYKSPAILITILPQEYLERCKILSSPFTDLAADPLAKLCSVSDLQPDDRGRLCTHLCLPPAICMTVASQYHSEPWALTPFPPHVTMNNPLAQFQLCQSTPNECSSWRECSYEYLYFRASSVSPSFQSGLGFQPAIIRCVQAPFQYLSIATQLSNHFSLHTCHTYCSSQVRMNHQRLH